jgi:hypothetical protein
MPLLALLTCCAAAVPLHLWLNRGTHYRGEELAFAWEFEHVGTGVFATWYGWFTPLQRLTYNVAFATSGVEHYLPLLLFALAANLALVAAAYWYCREIGRPWAGTLLAVFLLLFGAAVHSLLFPLNAVNALSTATLPAAMVLLGRGRRSTDLWALAVLLVGMSYGGPGVLPVCAGLAVWLLMATPRRWLRLLVPAIPVAIYLVALRSLPGGDAIAYVDGGLPIGDNLLAAPGLLIQAASGMAGAVAGMYRFAGAPAAYGPALAALGALGMAWTAPRLPAPARRRVVALSTAMLAAWAMIALSRGQDGIMDHSRYLLFGTVPALLIAVELASALRSRGRAVLAALLAGAALANANLLKDFAFDQRRQGELQRTELAALELALDRAPKAYQPDPNPATPALLFVNANTWRKISDDLGSFAIPHERIAEASPDARARADRILRELGGVSIGDIGVEASSGSACIAGAGLSREIALPPGGLLVAARRAGPVSISSRRFHDGYAAAPDASVPPGATYAVVPVPDASPVSWTVRLGGAFGACRMPAP